MEWTSIVLALIALLSSCGWLVSGRKYRQEVESLKADNRQKDMDLSKMYVHEFKENIAEPLRQEVRELRNEVDLLRNAIQRINDCPMAPDCPVLGELQSNTPGKGEE